MKLKKSLPADKREEIQKNTEMREKINISWMHYSELPKNIDILRDFTNGEHLEGKGNAREPNAHMKNLMQLERILDVSFPSHITHAQKETYKQFPYDYSMKRELLLAPAAPEFHKSLLIHCEAYDLKWLVFYIWATKNTQGSQLSNFQMTDEFVRAAREAIHKGKEFLHNKYPQIAENASDQDLNDALTGYAVMRNRQNNDWLNSRILIPFAEDVYLKTLKNIKKINVAPPSESNSAKLSEMQSQVSGFEWFFTKESENYFYNKYCKAIAYTQSAVCTAFEKNRDLLPVVSDLYENNSPRDEDSPASREL